MRFRGDLHAPARLTRKLPLKLIQHIKAQLALVRT
jgi:hypothetical protein